MKTGTVIRRRSMTNKSKTRLPAVRLSHTPPYNSNNMI